MGAVTETIRPCPRCGGWPATIYEPRIYHYGGADHVVRQSYCATCKKPYAQKRRRLKNAQQPLPLRRPQPRKARLTDATLTDILASPEKWARAKTGSRRWQHLRSLILMRDDNLCQIGGPTCTGQATQVDHIVPWPEGDSHPTNLRAACGPCNGARFQRAEHVCLDCGSLNVARIHT